MTTRLQRFAWTAAVLALLPIAAPAQPQGPPALVETAEVETGQILEELTLTGTIRPLRFSRVPSQVNAVVTELLVEAGDLVEEGQPLAVLRMEPARFSLREAEATLAVRRAQLEELEAGFRPEDIAAARADVEDAAARVDLAEIEETRQKSLLEREAVSQSEFDRAAAEARRARAELARLEAVLARLKAGPRSEEIARARAEVQSAEARLERLRDDLELHTIRAPFSGVIGSRAIDVGDWAREGEMAFAMAALETLRIEARLPERYFHRVHPGDEVSVSVDALAGQRFSGPIAARVPLGDDASRTFPVKVDLPNPGLRLAPGMLGRATFGLRALDGEEQDEEEVILVPRDAVVMAPDRSRSVWAVREGENGMTAQPVEITVGRTYLGKFEIVEGDLQPGDKIVVRGNELLRPGQTVMVINGPQPEGRPSGEMAGPANGTPANSAR